MHHFYVLHDVFDIPEDGFRAPLYDAIKADPPQGCVPQDFDGIFGLECRRPGSSLLVAVAELVAEVRDKHGLVMTDLGVEKVFEWSSDGRDGFGGTVLGQLLLMTSYRAQLLGYSVEEIEAFLRSVRPR